MREVLFFFLLIIGECTARSHLSLGLRKTLQNSSSSAELTAVDDGFKRGLNRVNYDFQPVSNTFDPQNIDYFQSMVMLAIPGIFIGIIAGVGGFFYFICKECCDICGHREANKAGYTVAQRYIPKQIVLAVALVTIGSAVVGYAANSEWSSGFKQFFEVIEGTVVNVDKSVSSISADLSSIGQTGNESKLTATLEELTSFITEVETYTKSREETTLRYDSFRKAAINLGFMFAIGSAACGIVGALFNQPFACRIMSVTTMLGLVFLWVSFGIHFPVSVMLADFCAGIEDVEDTGTATDLQDIPGLSSFLVCVTNSSLDGALEIVNQAADLKIDVINNITKDFGDLYDFQNFKQLDLEDYRSASISAFQTLNDTLLDVYAFKNVEQELIDLENCTFVRKAYSEIHDKLCVTMLKSLDLIMGATGLIGCLFFPGFWASILGIKRFNTATHRSVVNKRKEIRMRNARKKREYKQEYKKANLFEDDLGEEGDVEGQNNMLMDPEPEKQEKPKLGSSEKPADPERERRRKKRELKKIVP